MTPVSPDVRARLVAQTTQMWAPDGVIDLGIGQPDDTILPVKALSGALTRAGSAARGYPLQYGTETGDGYLKLALADYLTPLYGFDIDPERMLISNGNSQALDLVCGALTRPGDVVLVEEPSYFLALDIFADHRLTVVGVPVDDDGLSIDALKDALTRHRPAFLYTIPAFQNPTGSTLPSARRRALVDLAREHGFLVVADEVYHLLRYDGQVPEPMAAHIDAGVVLSLGTFSKILAPGLRVGWVQADRPLLDRLAARGFIVSGGGLNPFTGAIVADVVRDGSARRHLDDVRRVLGERVAVMAGSLREHLPAGATFRTPTGGYFFWVRLPDGVRTREHLDAAAALGVGYRPGDLFSTTGGHTEYLRLSFAYYGSDAIRTAIEALGQAFG